jgi:hypothetical protein
LYFGSINEFKQGVLKEEKVPPKPVELLTYERIKSTGLHLYAGGLMDQPHIWLMQWEMVEAVLLMWEVINRQSEQADQQARNLMAPQKFG